MARYPEVQANSPYYLDPVYHYQVHTYCNFISQVF